MKKIITLLVFVLIIKITQAQNGNVGIGTNNPMTKLDIVGAISTQSGTPVVVSGNTTITVGNSSFIKITTSVAIPANAKVSLSNGLQDGQLLTLYVAADSLKGVVLNNSNNMRLTKTPLNLMGRSASYFIWDASNNLWIELGHVPTLPTKQVFAHTGSQQIFTVPVGITSIKVKMWGAGGGAGYSASTGYGTSGGSGGYVEGVLTVTPLQNIVVVVGDGGSTSTIGETPLGFIAGLGGGAAGGTCNSLGAVGIGGGASYITSMSGTVYAVAGGGGGAGGSPNAAGTQSFGGAGGGATGGNGGNGNAGSSGGKGGTASAGGAGGTGLTNNGLAGSAFNGGNGGNSSSTTTYGGGGGGGGGYYGGGGGAGGTSTAGNSGGGGGGSSYVNPTYFSVTSNLQGSSGSGGGIKTAPNNTDPDYIAGTGEAGYVGTYIYSAGDGLIVFYW